MVFIPFYCHNLYSRPHVLTNREKAKREKLPTCNPVQSKVGFTDCWHLWLYWSPTYLLHRPPSLAGLQSTVVKLGGHLVLIWPPHYTVTARLTYSQTITRASPCEPLHTQWWGLRGRGDWLCWVTELHHVWLVLTSPPACPVLPNCKLELQNSAVLQWGVTSGLDWRDHTDPSHSLHVPTCKHNTLHRLGQQWWHDRYRERRQSAVFDRVHS